MSLLSHFSLPYSGMKDGLHTYRFEVDNSFFKALENCTIEGGQLNVEVIFDKRGDTSSMSMNIQGHVLAVCDRCLTDIELPLESTFEHIVKVTRKSIEAENDDIIHISEDQHTIMLAQIIYENIILSMPIRNVFECNSLDPIPCDLETLQRLYNVVDETDSKLSDLSGLIDFTNDN